MNREEFRLYKCEYEVIKPHEFLPYGGLDIAWDSNEGFGHYLISFDGKGGAYGDSECMDVNGDKWFTKKLMEKFAEDIDIKR